MHKIIVLLLPVYLISLNPAVADFIVEDKFWGLECKYYFACKRVFVDGVDTGEGIKPLPAKFPVSYIHEYNEKVGVCHIKVGGGLFSWLAGFVKKQNFYSKQEDGSFKRVSIEDLSFKCVKEWFVLET